MKADAYIRSLGFEAYRVGGSVRDELLDRQPKDADYVVRNTDLDTVRARVSETGGKPSKLQLRDGRQIGVRANVKGLGLVEIALPRTEISTGPGRHDFEIVVDPALSLREDAIRRDFTINALYRNVETNEILDPLQTGVDAVKQRVLITTHPNSFRDDPLRILRAVRFVARGFAVDERTEFQMRDHAAAVNGLTVKGVSGTAFDELCKTLMGRYVGRALRLMRDSGVMAVLLPELKPMLGFEQESRYHDLTTDEHTFVALEAAAGMHCDLRVRVALLFHDAGKPESAWVGEDGRKHYYSNGETEDHEVISARLASEALARLNAPNTLRKDVDVLIRRHMVSLSGKTRPAKVRRWRCELGDELLADLFKHRLCDVMGKGSIDNAQLMALARLEQIREDAQRHRVPKSVKELTINGHDAMERGLEGKQIGEVLTAILHEVVSQPDKQKLSRDWQVQRLEARSAKVRVIP